MPHLGRNTINGGEFEGKCVKKSVTGGMDVRYVSTRGKAGTVTAASAIVQGLARDGGLFVPVAWPHVGPALLHVMSQMNYQARAVNILALFLTDFSLDEVQECVAAAYDDDKFDHPHLAPVVTPGDGKYFLELWHGPTSAFKDMALQLMPHLLCRALGKERTEDDVLILVATSGDTGKAALEGFKNVARTRIAVFYPHLGVSEIQRLQMVTQEGDNVYVAAVAGNFDDAQRGVKELFQDQELADYLTRCGYRLSSANSINWGRLVPQVVYYFSAYCDMVKQGAINLGEPVNFIVPTGNFGNILAGYYAKRMGLPIGRLVCASNANNVLTDFLCTGRYDRRRKLHKTISPSMDILVSSNLERLLYHVTQGDAAQVAAWMRQLEEEGYYQVPPAVLAKVQEVFWGGWAGDEAACDAINRVWRRYGYLMDPHTAVAYQVGEDYRRETGDDTPAIIVSTASPFKFNRSVLSALGVEASGPSEFDLLFSLSRHTGLAVPPQLASLQDKPCRHPDVYLREKMCEAILTWLGKINK